MSWGWQKPFVLFSSATGTFPAGPGRAATPPRTPVWTPSPSDGGRRSSPGQSLAWTLWEQRSALTGRLADADVRRIARSGMPPLSTRQGSPCSTRHWRPTEAALLLMRLDSAAQGRAEAGTLPSLLRELVRPSLRRAAAHSQPSGGGVLRGASPSSTGRGSGGCCSTWCAHAADVLGHPSPDALEAARAFRELGFDSLASVELRNRLTAATGPAAPGLPGVRPHPLVLADHLRTELTHGQSTNATSTPVPAALPAIRSSSCRWPASIRRGVGRPEDLWRLVTNRLRAALPPFPADRGWDLDDTAGAGSGPSRERRRPGESGFLADAGEFDAGVLPDLAAGGAGDSIRSSGCCWRFPGRLLEQAGIDPRIGCAVQPDQVFTGLFTGQGTAARLIAVRSAVSG